jgi:hypothetical protein
MPKLVKKERSVFNNVEEAHQLSKKYGVRKLKQIPFRGLSEPNLCFFDEVMAFCEEIEPILNHSFTTNQRMEEQEEQSIDFSIDLNVDPFEPSLDLDDLNSTIEEDDRVEWVKEEEYHFEAFEEDFKNKVCIEHFYQ